MPALDLHPTFRSSRFTLRGLFTDSATAARKVAELEASGMMVLSFSEIGPSGSELHFVAARHDVAPVARAGIPHDHSADWEATRMAVQVFRDTVRAARRGNRAVRWYKGLDVEGLHRCIRRYKWDQTKQEVASHILSTTIIAHPFPNANHRTSLALARLYLASAGVSWPSYDLRGRGAARLFRDTHGYYRDSKYLLQLLRHQPLVRAAADAGFTHLLIGPGTEAEIRRADLSRTAEEIRREHLVRSSQLIEGLCSERDRPQLRAPNRSGLRDWVSWYRGSAP